HHRHLHSFPTRRSSDLRIRAPIATNRQTCCIRVVPANVERIILNTLSIARIIQGNRHTREYCTCCISTHGSWKCARTLICDNSRSEEHTSELQSLAYLV